MLDHKQILSEMQFVGMQFHTNIRRADDLDKQN